MSDELIRICYQNLANRIIEEAVVDFRKWVRNYKIAAADLARVDKKGSVEYYQCKSLVTKRGKRVRDIVKFFYSEDYNVMSKTDGRWLINKVAGELEVTDEEKEVFGLI